LTLETLKSNFTIIIHPAKKGVINNGIFLYKDVVHLNT